MHTLTDCCAEPKVAALGEVVTVTTEAPKVETTRTEISNVINTQQIQNLPVSGRLFTDFALLTPGVATGRTSLGTTFTEFEITQISFGGMRSFSNIITVDGADFINSNTGVQRATPPQESVSEFRVVNNSFGSEYGRALGGIVNVVTKSGTNDLHGSIYDYLHNSAADSRSLLQPRPAPFLLRQNQFGGTLGGPIRKDKTFFFMNYEGQRRSEAPVSRLILEATWPRSTRQKRIGEFRLKIPTRSRPRTTTTALSESITSSATATASRCATTWKMHAI